jgi:hypothetical protein
MLDAVMSHVRYAMPTTIPPSMESTDVVMFVPVPPAEVAVPVEPTLMNTMADAAIE